MIVRGTEGGKSWSELAHGDPLAAVLDPADTTGAKNRLVDRVHKHALARVAPNVRGKDVLDFGCGTGRLSQWFARRGARVTGVDVTPEMIEVARSLVPLARFYAMEGAAVPCPDDAFDLAVTAYVLQYYVAASPSILRDVTRVLRPGGRLVAIEQVTEIEHGRGGTVKEYQQLMSDAGLDTLEAHAIRLGASPLIGEVSRHRSVSRLPMLPWYLEREAQRVTRRSGLGDDYADFVFVASARSGA